MNAAHLRHSPGSGRVTHRDAAPETLAPSEDKRTRTAPACHRCAELLLIKDKKLIGAELTVEYLYAAEVREDKNRQPKLMWS